jgi:hypothetical protein
MVQAGSSSLGPDQCRPVDTVPLHLRCIPHVPRCCTARHRVSPLSFPLQLRVCLPRRQPSRPLPRTGGAPPGPPLPPARAAAT